MAHRGPSRLLVRLLALALAGAAPPAAAQIDSGTFHGGGGQGSLVRFKKGLDLEKQPDTRGALDDWAPFEAIGGAGGADGAGGGGGLAARLPLLLVPGSIGLGALAKAQGAVPRPQADGLRRITFMGLLPAFLLRHIWLCQLDSQLYAVAAWSLGFHFLWFLFALGGAQRLEPLERQMCGWTMMMSTGAMNSFLYPLLLGSSAFGEKALAACVLWDLGGNMWICQFALFAIAAFFRPNDHRDTEEVRSGVELAGAGDGGEADEEESEALLEKPNPLSQASAVAKSLSEKIPRQIFIDALKQPVLISCVLGFVLNLLGAELPWVLDAPLWFFGEPYKLFLYFLVGFYGDLNLTSEDVRRLGRALMLRYTASAAVICGIFVLMPFEPLYKYTAALGLLSPVSSYLIFLVGEHGYGESMMRLTVCGGFVSTIVSTIAQTMVIEMFAAASAVGGGA